MPTAGMLAFGGVQVIKMCRLSNMNNLKSGIFALRQSSLFAPSHMGGSFSHKPFNFLLHSNPF